MITISKLCKTYPDGTKALTDVDLKIESGELLALLGPNGAGKTTLISTICGIANATSGTVSVGGYGTINDYRQARSLIGLVPQELTTDAFETVWDTVNFSRGLFGKPKNPALVKDILTKLSLWNKKDNQLMTLSGGMKRRVMIAKALSHEPKVLFLDEPTAGVDVELRKDMWEQVRALRSSGVTIILTTHYIEEAEEMADRVGIINGGQLVLVEDKDILMKKLGSKTLVVELESPLDSIPDTLGNHHVTLENGKLVYSYDTKNTDTGIPAFLNLLSSLNMKYVDLETRESSLEEIFVGLVNKQ